ncbi:ATP-binding cassette domain-containing protein [Weissella paramesenteroides]|uniref:ATP-binding cassette domain-containing protein n=1 Tax=Weissella paramesenteroides TaxID=1249 RepID=A0ABD4XL17_WEIPA|nr:ABC transporter ATP-binding protein/permease [Weissella paramesenteroides]MDF8369818.1 ATP-binding cassette domain-containing protein [Weissella paramesenteroides]MDF8371843.1 ATP-binding cassette domain-containing protein [Weissella paramesenteroides]
MAYLELRDIHKSYYLGKEEFPVLKGINLDFELGEFVSILGESGGGKSTLMNIIGGLDREFEGSITIDGQLLDHKQEKQLDEYRRGTIGYIYQSYNLISHLTVLENVMVSLEMTSLSQAEKVKHATSLLERVGLAEQIKKHPNQLSGGQKQRVAIARALASDPQIIIADEPTGALDSENTADVLRILDEIAAEGRLVIAVTHSQEVADHGTRIVHLADGQIDDDRRLREAYAVPEHDNRMTDRPLPASASYRNAYKHLTFSFWRNSLIMLGTAIGLFAVMLFSGLGNGVKAYINDQVNSLANPTAITVTRYQDEEDGNSGIGQTTAGSGAVDISKQMISDDQMKQIKHVKGAKKVQPGYQLAGAKAKLQNQDYNLGTVQTWSATYQKKLVKAGKVPGKNEILVDKKTVAKKFNTKNWQSVVGKTMQVTWMTVKADGRTPVTITKDLKISGVIDAGKAGTANVVNYQTVRSAYKEAGAATNALFATVRVATPDDVKPFQKRIAKLKGDDNKRLYSAVTVGSILDTINTIVTLATNVLAAIAAISLVVSALMIIVTMFMSVSERTKEIGILRALGESKKDIRRLFTSESLLIGLASFVLSVIFAYGIGAILNAALYKIAKFDMIQISFGNVVTTLVLALIISFLAALLPARRAAKLNPIDALAAD